MSQSRLLAARSSTPSWCRRIAAASGLNYSMDLARRTGIPLIVACSKAARKEQVVAMAAAANVAVFALDLPLVNPLGISFATSTDEEIRAASPGWTRDLSMKRNLGLILARMLED